MQAQCRLVFHIHVMRAVFSHKQAPEITQFIFIIPAKVLSIQRQDKGCKKENTENSSEVRSIVYIIYILYIIYIKNSL